MASDTEALDIILRMIVHPGMIAGRMIGHKIQDQPHASLVQSGTQAEQSFQAPKLLGDVIIPHGIRGADTIVEGEVIEGRLQRHDRGSILSHRPSTIQTGLPHPHEPDSVDLPAPPRGRCTTRV